MGVDISRNSQEIFESPDDSFEKKKKRKQIALETIQDVLLNKGLSGRSENIQKIRSEILTKVFGSSSKTFIEDLSVEKLEEGVSKLKGLDPDNIENSQTTKPKDVKSATFKL